MNIPAPTSSAGSAPQIADGLAVARFDDITYRVHEDWAVDKDKFGKVDDGGRFHFNATILDEQTRKPVMLMDVKSDADDPTEEFALDTMTRNMSSHEKSSAYTHLKGILTPSEFKLWLDSTPENPADLSNVTGREVNIMVSHTPKGWPQIEAFLGAAKPKK